MESKAWDKIAKKYHKDIISPFREGVRSPLKQILLKIPKTKNKKVLDLGCGRGEFLSFISENFEQVYAIDFSNKMLKIAKSINKTKKNIVYKKQDMRNLYGYKEYFDVIISVNSILAPSIFDVKKILHHIHNSLKRGGYFIGIFPSIESYIYQSMLIFHRELSKNNNEIVARKETGKIFEEQKYDFIKGTYADHKNEVQKFFYQFELNYLLIKTGFSDLRFRKVLYPWEKDIFEHKIFSGENKMWDWLVISRKK